MLETGAPGVYERLGFRTTRTQVSWSTARSTDALAPDGSLTRTAFGIVPALVALFVYALMRGT